MNLSRRSFLRTAALGTVGAGAVSMGLLAGCAPQPKADGGSPAAAASDTQAQAAEYPVQTLGSMDEPTESFEGDVVVLGCGPGGIACATRLAEQGARVLVVEKTDNVGGTGLVASGNCYISLNSKYQTDQGLEADIPAFYKEWLEAVHYHCDHEVLSTYLRNCGRVVDWLMGYGFGFYMKETPPTNGLSGNAYRISQPPKDEGNRQETYGKMMGVVEKAGGALHTGCTGTELIVDDEGTVVGLRATRGSDVVDFMGKAVVIASGGYGANQEMINEYASVPLLGRDPVLNNGEGARMAWAAGAKKPWNLGILCVDTLYPIDEDYQSYKGGIQALGNVMQDPAKARMHVNQLGRRFHSEDAFCWVPTYAGTNAVACDEPWLYVIADQAAIDALKENDETVDDAYLKSMETAGVMYAGETPRSPRPGRRLESGGVRCRVRAVREALRAGRGPRSSSRRHKHLVPYGDGPYYAVRMAPTPFGTCGDLERHAEDGGARHRAWVRGEGPVRRRNRERWAPCTTTTTGPSARRLAGPIPRACWPPRR